MGKRKNIEAQELFDRILDTESEEKLRQKLERDPALKEEYLKLNRIDHYLKGIKVEDPSVGFTDSVLAGIEKPLEKPGFNWNLVLLTLGILVMVAITAVYVGGFDSQLVNVPDEVNLLNKQVSIEGASRFLNIKVLLNGLLFIAFLLAMMLFDRAVLYPLFREKNVSQERG